MGVRRQERKTSTVAGASGRASLRASERRHSPFIRQRRQKAMPARRCGKSQLSIAREGFLDRRSKRCFWLLLSPQTKVARAGARNYPRRRQILRLRRCAATPHPPPSGAPSPQGEGLGVRRQERKTPAVAGASGRGSLRAGERRHSPFIRQRRQKAMPARIRRKSHLSIAREWVLRP